MSCSRAWIIGVLLAALALLGGCTTARFAYGQAPMLAYWWLDGYIDFDDPQEAAVRDAIADWFRWHRATQLSDYAELLARAETQVMEPTTGEQVCRWVDEIGLRFDRAVERAIVAGSDTLRAVSAEQVRHLERKYAKGNAEFAKEFLQTTPEERLQASIKRVVQRAEFFYGKLEPAQRERIVQGVTQSPYDADLWTIERRLRQQDVLQTLRSLGAEHASAEEALTALRAVYERTRRSPREPYRAYQQRLAQTNCALAAEVHNLATPAQRREMARRFKGWEGDARALAAER